MPENENYSPDSVYAALRGKLCEYGLSERIADTVLAQQIANDTSGYMKGRWNTPASNIKPTVMDVLWMDATIETIKWMDKNMPNHFARPLFAEGPEEVLRQTQAARNATGLKLTQG